MSRSRDRMKRGLRLQWALARVQYLYFASWRPAATRRVASTVLRSLLANAYESSLYAKPARVK